MVYSLERHNRRSMRLKGYDYSQPGFYYVTICTQDRVERFGDVQNDKMILNDAGEMVDAEWNRIPERYGHVVLDKYQIMPNHMHGILEIRRRGVVPAPSRIMDKPDLIDIGDEPIVPSPTNSDNPLMQSHMNDEISGNINEKTDMETGDLCDASTNDGAETETKGETSTREGAETTPLNHPQRWDKSSEDLNIRHPKQSMKWMEHLVEKFYNVDSTTILSEPKTN